MSMIQSLLFKKLQMTNDIKNPITPDSGDDTKLLNKRLSKIVVPSYQSSREKLKENLISLRSQWEAGKEIARTLLSVESQKDWYKESKKSYEQIVANLENLIKSPKGSNLWGEELKDDLENLIKSPTGFFQTTEWEINSPLKNIYDYHRKTWELYDEKLINLINKILDWQTKVFQSGSRNYEDNYYEDNYNRNRYVGAYYKTALALDNLDKFTDILPIEEQEKYLRRAIDATYFVQDRYVYYSKWQKLQQGAHPAEHDKFDCIKSYSSTWHLSDTKDLYSCKRYLEPLLMKVFSKTKNSEFMNAMIVPLIHYWYDLKKILPKNLQDEYLTEGNIKNIVNVDSIKNNKTYLWEVLLSLHKNGISFSYESTDYCLSLMNELKREKIPLIRRKTWFADEGRSMEEVFNVITSDKQKDFFKNIYKDNVLDVELLQELKNIYSSSVIWEWIKKDCLSVEFINSNLDDLSSVLDGDGVVYILRHINVSKNWKKLNQKTLEKFKIWDMVRENVSRYDGYDRSIAVERGEIAMHKEMAELIVKKVDFQTIPSCIPGYALYDALSKEGMLDKKHMEMFSPRDMITYYVDRLSSIHSNAGTPLDYYWHERYKKTADDILDTSVLPVIKKHLPEYINNVLQSGDLNKIKNIVSNDGYRYGIFRKNMSKEQIDLLINKILENINTQEDLQFLEKYLLGNNYHYGFNCFNLPITYLLYRFCGKYPSIDYNSPIPASVYKDMLLKGMIKGTEKQPKIIDDSELKIPNFDKIISLFEQKIN